MGQEGQEGKDSNGGCSKGVGGAVVVLVVLFAMIPKPIWIVLGVVAALGLLSWVFYKGLTAWEQSRLAEEERAQVQRAQEAAVAQQEREAEARRLKQQRIQTLGAANAARVRSAQAAVKQVVASEAARTGWLGDVDFTADLKSIVDSFQKAQALRKVADQLSALDKPTADDRKILAEAKTTAAGLERVAIERANLIGKCATEAKLIDDSLRTERQDARTAEQRAELHAKLSSMLYGIEAAPPATATDSVADAVMARVQAYREIKHQIQLTRGEESGPR